MQTYTSDKYGFSFQYAPPFEQKDDTSFKLRAVPAARTRWQCSTPMGRRSAGGIATPSGECLRAQHRITEENLDAVQAELEQSVIPQLEQSSENMQISELSPVTVSGLNGFEADATSTSKAPHHLPSSLPVRRDDRGISC